MVERRTIWKEKDKGDGGSEERKTEVLRLGGKGEDWCAVTVRGVSGLDEGRERGTTGDGKGGRDSLSKQRGREGEKKWS